MVSRRGVGTNVDGEAEAVAHPDAWVQCDKCTKWRRITYSESEKIGDGDWFCGMNGDARFNACESQQELSDEEIDKLLSAQQATNGGSNASSDGSSESSGESDDSDDASSSSGSEEELVTSNQPVIVEIDTNVYTYRRRKKMTDEDVMVCQCKPNANGDACNSTACLNRVLNVECIDDHCPCGAKAQADGVSKCRNQRFQRREGVKLNKLRCGAKGWGLCSEEDLKQGQFITEYCGEVLEETTYHDRRRAYKARGQRHYYFMTLNSNEVIDACHKGNIARFTNHSCEPNCETQKWQVRGDLCIGFFALKDIPAGTELTFDYNFERYGEQSMRCLCGTKSCRGQIGGEEQEHYAPVDIDKWDDELDPEPVFMRAEGEASTAAELRQLQWERQEKSRVERHEAQRAKEFRHAQRLLQQVAAEGGVLKKKKTRHSRSGKPKKEKKEKRKSGDGEGEQEEEADSSDDEQLMLGVDASLLEREAARAEREARKARKKSKRAKQSRAERVERKPGSGGGGSSAVKKNAEQLKKEERERQKALQQAHDREMRLKFEAKQRERLKMARLAAAQRALAAEKEAREAKQAVEAACSKPAHPFKKMMMTAIKEEEKAKEGKQQQQQQQREVKVEVKAREATPAAGVEATAEPRREKEDTVPKTQKISIQKKRASQGTPVGLARRASTQGQGGSPAVLPAKRTTVERRLDQYVTDSGAVRDKEGVLQVVLLFKETRILKDGLSSSDRDGAQTEVAYSMRDLSLLLDAIKASKGARLQNEFVKCNVLGTLLPILLHLMLDYDKGTPVLRKALKLLLSLPVSPEQANGVRSSKGSLADAMYRMYHHRDQQVQQHARQLIQEWKLPAGTGMGMGMGMGGGYDIPGRSSPAFGARAGSGGGSDGGGGSSPGGMELLSTVGQSPSDLLASIRKKSLAGVGTAGAATSPLPPGIPRSPMPGSPGMGAMRHGGSGLQLDSMLAQHMGSGGGGGGGPSGSMPGMGMPGMGMPGMGTRRSSSPMIERGSGFSGGDSRRGDDGGDRRRNSGWDSGPRHDTSGGMGMGNGSGCGSPNVRGSGGYMSGGTCSSGPGPSPMAAGPSPMSVDAMGREAAGRGRKRPSRWSEEVPPTSVVSSNGGAGAGFSGAPAAKRPSLGDNAMVAAAAAATAARVSCGAEVAARAAAQQQQHAIRAPYGSYEKGGAGSGGMSGMGAPGGRTSGFGNAPTPSGGMPGMGMPGKAPSREGGAMPGMGQQTQQQSSSSSSVGAAAYGYGGAAVGPASAPYSGAPTPPAAAIGLAILPPSTLPVSQPRPLPGVPAVFQPVQPVQVQSVIQPVIQPIVEPPAPPAQPPSRMGEPSSSGYGGGGGSSAPSAATAVNEWKTPEAPSFEAAVSEMIRHRVWKYRQKDHWLYLEEHEAVSLHDRLTRTVVQKEVKSWKGHQQPISRESLEKKVRKFVHDHVHNSKLIINAAK